MSEKLLRNIRFRSIINKFYGERKARIVDIVLFGSTMRGKEKPADVDIMLLSLDALSTDEVYELRKPLESIGLKPNLVSMQYKSLFSPSFKARQAYLTEGYSLINNISLSKGLGFSSSHLFKYDLRGMSNSRRMQFYYSLYGRGGSKGMLKQLNAKKFSNTTILVPTEKSEEAKEYFLNNKIKFAEIPELVPEYAIPEQTI